MSALIDDISRAIASPVSRRKVFKMVSGAVGSALLASLGLGRATGALGADGEGDPRCQRFWVRCNGKCYPPGFSCCGRTACDRDDQCCKDHCCEREHTCCGSRCCQHDSTCCGDNTCCPRGVACCNGKCCSQPRAICCGGECCPEGYLCCANKCVKSRPSPSTACFPV